MTITNKTLATQWFNLEQKRNFTRGLDIYTRAQRQIDQPYETFQTNFPEIWSIIKHIQRQVNKPANNGRIVFNPDAEQKFWVTGQSGGAELDTKQLCAEILGALGRREPRTIIAHIREIKPQNPNEMLEKIHIRSQYSTIFTDNHSRECNIALALEAFDGQIIQAGERVSFNDLVGKRTRERGFQEAKIILDGEFVDGVGGGVCQASTTIFNAVMLAGLAITQSHNHSIPITYVPLGRDAMVSSLADLQFKNNTGAPIYIEAKTLDHGHKNSALVRIYGAQKTHDYRPRVEVTTTGDPAEYEIQPRTALTYLDIYQDGELVNTKLIRKSRYKGKPRPIPNPPTTSPQNHDCDSISCALL